MEKSQKKYLEGILNQYQDKEQTKFEELKNLDQKVKKPANIFAYIYGSIGALVLGMGMCAAMNTLPKVILEAFDKPVLMALGIIVGIVGILMTVSTFFIYKKILVSRRKKYSNEIIALTEEILNK